MSGPEQPGRSGTPISWLPYELLVQVFKCLPWQAQYSLKQVCRKWRAIINGDSTILSLRYERVTGQNDALRTFPTHCVLHFIAYTLGTDTDMARFRKASDVPGHPSKT